MHWAHMFARQLGTLQPCPPHQAGVQAPIQTPTRHGCVPYMRPSRGPDLCPRASARSLSARADALKDALAVRGATESGQVWPHRLYHRLMQSPSGHAEGGLQQSQGATTH
eukprot:scaffold48597_cov24-Tisochrysis_lutea.AAC.1